MPIAKKLPSGSWRCQVFSHYEYYLAPDGTQKKKRIYKSFTSSDPSRNGKKEAERLAAEYACTKQENTIENLTLSEAYTKYIESKSNTLSPSTIREYERQQRTNLPSLMPLKLEDLTQELIQIAINEEACKRSPKTVRNIHGLLSAVLSVYHPGLKLNTALPKKVRTNLYIPSDEEIKTLMEYLNNDVMEVPVLLAAFGPMRRGEICALEASDISGNVAHVNKTMVLNKENKWVVKAPKSYAGDRFICFPDFVIQKLNKSGRITELNPSMITDRFKDILERAGIPHFRFHDLRHYCASVQHALGVPDAYIMQRGGWGNDRVLKEVYRHALKDKVSEMDDKANNYFESMQHEMQHK